MRKVIPHSLIVAAGLGLAAASLYVRQDEEGNTAMSEEALSSTFESATRNLVINWDPTDLRPADERLEFPIQLHVSDLRRVRVDPTVALRQQHAHAGGGW